MVRCAGLTPAWCRIVHSRGSSRPGLPRSTPVPAPPPPPHCAVSAALTMTGVPSGGPRPPARSPSRLAGKELVADSQTSGTSETARHGRGAAPVMRARPEPRVWS
jgi:hypothetical protein